MRKTWAKISAFFLISLATAAAAASGAGEVVAGPMVGHVTERSARVWMQLATSHQVTITCIESRAGPVSEVAVDVEGGLPFTCDIPLTNLKPNKDYNIAVKLDGKPVTAGAGVVIRTAPPAGEEATFKVAMASGLTPDPKGKIPAVAAINALDPRAFFFLGNTLSLPAALPAYPTTHRQTVRFITDAYSQARQEPELQPLFRTTACYAIWSDHNFGITDADKNWIFKDEAWDAFQHFWPNPDWGTPNNRGCYFTMTLGDVDFFMLDARMYRDPDSDPARKTMLGPVQLDWLKQGLKDSKANFKVIGCASQLLVDYGQADTWADYQPEQHDFLKWLFANKISGVIFVTGGKHCGEITMQKGTPGEYPLFELTTSSLGKEPDALNKNRVGNAVEGSQFSTLDFGGVHDHRFVTLRIRDEAGKMKSEQTVFLTQMKK